MKGRKRKLSPAYARRIARGRKRGLTRSQARGHPAVGEKYISKERLRLIGQRKLQFVIRSMKEDNKSMDYLMSIVAIVAP
jgi:hypothetical protein